MASDDDDPTEIVRRLQAHADARPEAPIELTLGNQPGPYKVPLCTRVGLMSAPDMLGLRLETGKGHVILLPLSREALETLRNLMEFARPDEAPH